MKISIIGTGYVGLVTGTCLAEIGHEVIGIDKDKSKIEKLKKGISPIFEPALEEYISRNIGHERLSFTDDLAKGIKGSDIVFIAVGTPENEDGSADVSYVLNAASSIAKEANRDLIVVVKSTVPVGTCDLVEREIKKVLKDLNKDLNIFVASNPEFLKEGSAVEDFMKPERIIVGTEHSEVQSLFEELYEPFVSDDPSRLMIMDRKSSELAKYGANVMLATRITLMNELAVLCEKVGANIDEIRRAIGSDSRIGKKFLYAGPGYGGSCFPKDVEALIKTSEDLKIDFSVVKAVKHANNKQKLYALQKVMDWLETNSNSKKVAIWGLAFKPGTDDVRESPAVVIVQNLLRNGYQITAYDPRAIENFAKYIGDQPNLSFINEAYGCLDNADALVLITEWPEFKRPNWSKVKRLMGDRKAVFDFRNQYSHQALSGQYGFHYECIGRPDSKMCSFNCE